MATGTCVGLRVDVGRRALQEAYATVAGVVPRQTPKEVLRRLKLEVKGGTATLCGTDLEVNVRRVLAGAEVDGDGAVLLDADRLGGMLRATSSDRFAISVMDESIIASVDGCDYRMPYEDPAKFPDAMEAGEGDAITVSAADLKALIRRTYHAVDRKNRAVILGGLLLEWADGRLAVTGCDGNRLAKSSISAEGDDGAVAGRPVVPEKAAKLIEAAMDEGPATLSVRGPNVIVATDTATITARLLEGRYPDYEKIFPPESQHRARFKVVDFRRAFEMASVVTSEETRGVDVTFDGDVATFASGSNHAGRADAEAPMAYQGPKVEATLDWRYVLDGFKPVPDDSEAVMHAAPGCTRIMFKFDDYTFVVATMRRGE